MSASPAPLDCTKGAWTGNCKTSIHRSIPVVASNFKLETALWRPTAALALRGADARASVEIEQMYWRARQVLGARTP